MEKQITFKTKGMQRDMSASAFNSEFSYENMNVRIYSTDSNTTLSLINEKGTKKVENINIQGIVIGQAVIDNELILFTKGDKDRIYKIKVVDNDYELILLYEGHLNLNAEHPIETVTFYENKNNKKVYWTDNENPLRFINVATDDKYSENTSFDFITTLSFNELVSVSRNTSGGSFNPGTIQYAFTYVNKYGQQSNIFYTTPLYYLSHKDRGASPEEIVSNSFNIEIGLVDTSYDYIRIYSIHRTSINATPTVKRVVDLETKSALHSSNNYDLSSNINTIYTTARNVRLVFLDQINNTDLIVDNEANSTFNDNLIFNSGLDRYTWEFKKSQTSKGKILYLNSGDVTINCDDNTFRITIIDQNIVKIECFDGQNGQPKNIKYTGETSSLLFIDNGTQGDIVDPTELLYLGGEEIISGTLTHKDNTLFLGNIRIKREDIDTDRVPYHSVSFDRSKKNLSSPDIIGHYTYNNQLDLNSNQLKTFKYLEWYRLGIQAQHYTGKWSNPIWVDDVRNEQPLSSDFYNDNDTEVVLPSTTLQSGFIEELYNKGYRRVRPVIVYPTINDREVICQGVLCPTVYNAGDRNENGPFAQSSWFIRPYAPFEIGNEANGDVSDNNKQTIYSPKGITSNGKYTAGDTTFDTTLFGSWAEFRHNYPLPDNSNINAEIQCTVNPESPKITNDLGWLDRNKENYYVDHSIVTLHSPDIEFDSDIQNISMSDLNLRIVGLVPLTSFASDIDIQTSTPVLNTASGGIPQGFYKEKIGVDNGFAEEEIINSSKSSFGWRKCISGIFWIDSTKISTAYNNYEFGYAIYPWHRNGSLNDTKVSTDGYRSAMLDKKKLSNLNFSYKSVYLDKASIWYSNNEGTYNENNIPSEPGISGVLLFNSNEITALKVSKPLNSQISNDFIYYGNVDKVLSKTGYHIKISHVNSSFKDVNNHEIFLGTENGKFTDLEQESIDPVRIKYKSTPHAVMALNYTTNGRQQILPGTSIYSGYDSNTEGSMFWDTHTKEVFCNTITLPKGPIDDRFLHGWLWLGELYRINVANRFGGQHKEAFENNQWLPCGEPVSLSKGEDLKDTVTVTYEEGDTYYQRYDHLKTYPFTLEDQNSVTEIVSFMCETRVNIDGRYDRNRGQQSNLAITPQNFNLLNTVYSQSNNFFNYRITNSDNRLFNFPNMVTWTKTKTVGELVDTWTNITLASTLDLDGDKGKITALRKFNNSIIAFQDTGISQILYNENMQISTTEGVPIEIANSGKVIGKRYLSNNIGCINKWSICESPNGLYFIDNLSKGIYIFNGQVLNISDKFGFHSWASSNTNSLKEWNPVDFDNFVTYYDKVNNDVFFINKNHCLAFSETLGQFSSFYSYENTPFFANIQDKRVWIKDNTLWEHNKGDYNYFFNTYKPFYTTVVANPNMLTDKIFNNIEFRADTWDSNNTLLNTTFDTLNVWNEYQQGESTLVNTKNYPSNLKRKFRVWRTNIPRDKSNNRDRMRNPWLYIKLAMNHDNMNKTILHDLTVKYFE